MDEYRRAEQEHLRDVNAHRMITDVLECTPTGSKADTSERYQATREIMSEQDGSVVPISALGSFAFGWTD